MYIYSGDRPSKGARALSRAIPAKRVKALDKLVQDNIVINWGTTRMPYLPAPGIGILNSPEDVARAANKRSFFMIQGMEKLTPDYCVDKATADRLMRDNKCSIVCRTILSGHSGAGIVIANTPNELVEAPLYVEYVKKKWEFRAHVFRFPLNGAEVISFQQKARRLEVPNDQVNWQIRNHQNGFIYKREIDVPEMVLANVKTMAMRAFLLTDLDFGAVDVIWNEKQARAYVLEINTAPGLEGQTLDDYAKAFKAIEHGK